MADPAPEHPGFKCLADILKRELTFTQQMALLALRDCPPPCSAVAEKLKAPTVRANYQDYRVLVEKRLAVRGADGFHQVSGLGKVMAGALARELAREHGIATPLPRRPRGSFQPGFSQAGNW